MEKVTQAKAKADLKVDATIVGEHILQQIVRSHEEELME